MTLTVWQGNVTYNLGPMYRAVGWDFNTIGGRRAADLGESILNALTRLKADPGRYKAMNPPNGWGSYDLLVAFLEDFLAAVELNPNAVVRTWL